MDVQNRVALVTGAGVRLGQALAVHLAQLGMRIGVHYHRSEAGANETLQRLQRPTDAPGWHATFAADLRNVEALPELVEQVEATLGPIAVLVNNAADFFPTPLLETSEADWDHLFSLNLKAPFFLTQAVAARMLPRQEGKILNILDVAAERPWPGFLPYSATKAGLASLTQGLAKALAPHLQVNGIAPGTVLPPPESDAFGIEQSLERSLLKRIGDASDVTRAAQYLIESDFVTGTVMAVDGGRLLA